MNCDDDVGSGSNGNLDDIDDIDFYKYHEEICLDSAGDWLNCSENKQCYIYDFCEKQRKNCFM